MAAAVSNLVLASFFCGPPPASPSSPPYPSCEDFAARAAAILRVWFVDNSTSMLPNLYYGQIRPTATPPKRGHGGFIEWTNLPPLLDHVAMLRYAYPSVWGDDDDAVFRRWVVDFNSYCESPTASHERDMVNNHGSWFDSTWLAAALATGASTRAGGGVGEEGGEHVVKGGAALAAIQDVLHRRIDLQIRPNGSEWIELERANPAGYCVFNVDALANSATMAANARQQQQQQDDEEGGSKMKIKRVGELSTPEMDLPDVWGYRNATTNASLRGVVDWLLPYATGTTAWPFPQHSEAPAWGDLFSLFRLASIAYGSRAYEVAACVVVKGEGGKYANDELNLLHPRRFEVEC